MEIVNKLPLMGKLGTQLDRLSRTDLGPLLVLLSLFIISFCLIAGFMILMVLCWFRVLVAIFLIVKIGAIIDTRVKLANIRAKRGSNFGILKWRSKWLVFLGWWLPHEHRDAIMGDILEDWYEMRESGLSKEQMRTHVLWQWMIAVVLLFPCSVIRVVIRLWRAS
jgi:hypothetical protein